MQSRNLPGRKENRRTSRGRKQPKLSVRSTLVLLLALYAALADAGLLYAAHVIVPLIAVSAAGVFVTAYGFLDDRIE